jgi:site-specific recombinase XerD
MRSTNTFGVHFTLRLRRPVEGKFSIYARIVVNKSRCELSLKARLRKEDWNSFKGEAKPKNEELKILNSYLEETRGKIAGHYRELILNNKEVTAEAVKNSYMGVREDGDNKNYTLLWAVEEHNTKMHMSLKPGTMKNYFTTAKYLKKFLKKKYRFSDIPLKKLNYEFISNFEYFVKTNSIKENDPCTNNGTMKHIERLKKIVAWAGKNEWIDKNPFINFHLKFDRHERECLNETELSVIKSYDFENPIIQKVRDLFIFSCYTGLAYIDLVSLKPHHLVRSIDGVNWIKNSREKTGVAVNVPLLEPAVIIAAKFGKEESAHTRDTVFPKISNQEMNRSLKIIAEICGVKKYLTFHLARHTFATTVTLMNGVPIETISKMLGHTKLSTTMIYARVSQSKIGMDMELLQNKLNENRDKGKLVVIN